MKPGIRKLAKYDLSNIERCEDDPIHLIGTLQQFSWILGFSKAEEKIVFFSKNALSHIPELGENIQYWQDCLSLTNGDFFTATTWNQLENKNHLLRDDLLIQGVRFHLSAHHTHHHVILEFEQYDSSKVEDQLLHTEVFVQSANEAQSFRSFASAFTRLIKDLTGYDRVMVYRFDENYNGHVFAESKEAPLPAFYDLHYPHTDIPSQARELYKKKEIRMLEDVNSKDQQIYSFDNNISSEDIDLSGCNSRSVSPIHLQYMRNMGVAATLTLSILIDKQLWGMVSCHHSSPYKLDFQRRKQALLFTKLFGAQIRKWESTEEYASVQEKEHIYQSILQEIIRGNDKFEAATSTSYFIGLTESDGGAVIRGNNVYTFGSTPSNEMILRIHGWMIKSNERVFLSNEFSTYVDFADSIKDVASGVLYYSFDTDRQSAMVWFRKELTQGTKWGGRIDKSVKKVPLTPRSSFELWEEEVDGKSEEWKSYQIQAGLRLGAYLEKEVFIGNLKEQKQKLENLADQLKSKNEELSQFNWISSHDMKEPLRKIRLFIDQIRSEEENLSEFQLGYFDRLDASAQRMQRLIADLLDYAKLSREEAFQPASLNSIIEELVAHYESGTNKIQWRIDDLPTIECVRFQLKQLFSNLIGNSIKFKKEHVPLVIRITASNAEVTDIEKYTLAPGLEYVKIEYSDNGIGFSDDYSTRIFEVFQRLHSSKEYEGTGIGLAICKKIVASHHGEIYAVGQLGEGAVFTIFLPKKQPTITNSEDLEP